MLNHADLRKLAELLKLLAKTIEDAGPYVVPEECGKITDAVGRIEIAAEDIKRACGFGPDKNGSD